jgi:hypothetical protein
MKQIKIYEKLETTEDFIYCLDEIRRQLEKGYTSGINPTFDFEEEENKMEQKIWLTKTDLECLNEGEEITVNNKYDIEVK